MKPNRKTVLKGTLITGIGTLISRVLGMLRDSATAAMLGMTAGGVMDSFVMAFRLPDITRRMFGEGSLSVGFIPVFARLWLSNRKKAWKLVSAYLTGIFFLLVIIVVLGEIICLLGYTLFPPESKVHIAAKLTSLMLPYLILICLAAIAAASLQTLGKFFVPSLIPTILNICWLFGIIVIAPFISSDPLTRCYILTGCILFAGLIQFGIQIPLLYKFGFRYTTGFNSIKKEAFEVGASFFPTMIGLMATQFNVLVASAIAWAFSGNADEAIWWLGRAVTYPLDIGSASSIYFSERLYEFPQGMIGLAIATAAYPILSRHAATRNYRAIAEDLGFGLRTIVTLAIPAGVGIMMLSENFAHLLYQRGAFTPSDTFRTADMIFWFSFGICGFCTIPLLVRSFYAMGNIQTPLRIGIFCCGFNLFFGFTLIWVMKENGLALAASVAATLQSVLLFFAFCIKHHWLDVKRIALAAVRSAAAAAVMGLVVKMILENVHGASSISDIVRITLSMFFGAITFVIVLFILGGREIEAILKLGNKTKPQSSKSKRQK